MKEEIFNFLSKKFNKPVEEKTEFVELCEDSISRVETLFEVEQMVGKKLSENDVLDMETVGDLLKAIEK
jgi:acyl carrier protein